MEIPTVRFNNGFKMPAIGLGTSQSARDELEQAIKDAIDAGYRHFDTAYMYDNETYVGNALREKMADRTVTRDEIFVTTKLWNTFHSKELVVPACKESLKNLGLDYVDLYLIHWPIGYKENAGIFPKENGEIVLNDVDYLDTWKEMENCVKLGLTRSIGVSNFNSQQLDRLISKATIKPVNNQVECNPNINQSKLIKFCKDRDVIITAYCPLGRPGKASRPEYPHSSIDEPKIIKLGKKYRKTAAQIILRYLFQNEAYPLPKSVTKSRIIDNINIFDFELNEEDLTIIDSLNTNRRILPVLNMKHHKYYPFNIEF